MITYEMWVGERFSFGKCFALFRSCGLGEALAKASISKNQKKRERQKKKKLAGKIVEAEADIEKGSDRDGKVPHDGDAPI